MIWTTGTSAHAGNLESYLGEELAALLALARRHLEEAAHVEARARQPEQPILKWEARVRVHPPRAAQSGALLAELTTALGIASGRYERIEKSQSLAIPLFLTMADRLRNTPTGREDLLPVEVPDLLERSAGLRREAVRSLQRAITLSAQIGLFPTRSTPRDILALIDDRRRLIRDFQARRSRADTLLGRAVCLEVDSMPDVEEAIQRALTPPGEVVVPGDEGYDWL
jgi:hypothetical protein